MKKNKCEFCRTHNAGDILYDFSEWESGIEFEKIHDIQYCPICGKKLTEYKHNPAKDIHPIELPVKEK